MSDWLNDEAVIMDIKDSECWRIAMEDILNVLLEKKVNPQIGTADTGFLYATDEDGNVIAVGEEMAYKSDEGLILSRYLADGSPRENSGLEKQMAEIKIEVLYLLSGDIKSGDAERIAEVKQEALPLPPGYSVGGIACQDGVFTISSKEGKPSICGAFEVIKCEFHSVPYSYHTRGMTVGALELYYYEVLAEGQQLYMEERTFKREMKARRKRTERTKSTKEPKKKLAAEDFHKGADGTYTCEKKVKLWGVTTWIYASFQGAPEQCVRQMEAHILWVEKHRKEIERKLLDSDMVTWANHWVDGHDSFEENGQVYYELEDGTVPYPVTEEAFLENLYIQSVTIQGGGTPDTAGISMFLDTVPSYFGDHIIQLSIDAKKDISESARTKWKYAMQKAGVAG